MVPTTRSMSVINKEIIEHFDKLIEPLVTISSLKELLKELKDGIINSLELKIQEQDEKIRSLEDKIATQSGNFELRLKEQNDKIRSLEGKIVTQGVVIDQLQIAADNNESYSRRSCLRINNIPCDNNEDDIVLNKKIENYNPFRNMQHLVHAHFYIYIYIYICMYVCIYVYTIFIDNY